MAVAFVIAGVALLGAAVSFLAGALFYARALNAGGPVRPRWRWLSVAVWPFAIGSLGDGAERAAVNKALVAVLACTLVAGAAGSVAVNLQRMSAKG